jgi:hypothetical protein
MIKVSWKNTSVKLHRVNLQFFGAIFVGMLVTLVQQLKDYVTFGEK